MEMEKLKALLNNCNTQHEFVKLCDLEQEKKYEVTCFENINTKFGKKISVILDSKYKVILPDRFSTVFTKEIISTYNQKSKTKFNLIYNGLKNLKNGKTMHLIDFN